MKKLGAAILFPVVIQLLTAMSGMFQPKTLGVEKTDIKAIEPRNRCFFQNRLEIFDLQYFTNCDIDNTGSHSELICR